MSFTNQIFSPFLQETKLTSTNFTFMMWSINQQSSAPKKMIRYLLRFASLVSLPICFASIVDLANSETNSEIIYSVVSGSAHLPCNVSPPQGSNDEPRLILWYKDSDPQPVYSFDNRYTNPKHWSQVPLQFLIIWYLKMAKSQSWVSEGIFYFV